MLQNTGLKKIIERLIGFIGMLIERVKSLLKRADGGKPEDRSEKEGEYSIMPRGGKDAKNVLKPVLRVTAVLFLIVAAVLAGRLAYIMVNKTKSGETVTVKGIMKKKSSLSVMKTGPSETLQETPEEQKTGEESSLSFRLSDVRQAIQDNRSADRESTGGEPVQQQVPVRQELQKPATSEGTDRQMVTERPLMQQMATGSYQKPGGSQPESVQNREVYGYMDPFRYEVDPRFALEMENLYKEYQKTVWLAKIAKHRAEIAEANKKIMEATVKRNPEQSRNNNEQTIRSVKKEPEMRTVVWRLPTLSGVMLGERFETAMLSDGRSVTVDMEVYPGLRVVEIHKNLVVCQDRKGRLYRITPTSSDVYIVKVPAELADAYGLPGERKPARTGSSTRIPVRIPVRR